MTTSYIASLVAAVVGTFVLRVLLRRIAAGLGARVRPRARAAIASLVAPLHAVALTGAVQAAVVANHGDSEISSTLAGVALGFLALRVAGIVVYDWYLAHIQGIVLPSALRVFLNGVVVVVSVFCVLHFVLGISLFELGIVAVILAAAGALFFQGVARDFASGVSVWLQRGIEVGTSVRIQDFEGEVVAVDWKTTMLRVADGGLLSVPNQLFVSSPFVRWPVGEEGATRVTVHLAVPPSSSPNRVLDLARETARLMDGVLATPAPEALYEGERDGAARYQLHVWVGARHKRAELQSQLSAQLWYCLRREGIIVDAGVSPAVPVRSLLQGVPFLAVAGERTVAQLVACASVVRYGRGEILFSEGDPGESLFVVARGRLAIRVVAEGRDVVLAHASAGDFVGERSLLTGDPRTATVVAEEDTEVVVIGKDALLPALRDAPEVAVLISAEMAERDLNRKQSVTDAGPSSNRGTLLSRMRTFFGLG